MGDELVIEVDERTKETKPLRLLSSLLASQIMLWFRESLAEILSERTGYQKLCFVPFGRTPLVWALEGASIEPLDAIEVVMELMELIDLPFLGGYLGCYNVGRTKVLKGELEEDDFKLLEASKPLLQGELIPMKSNVGYKDWRGALVDLRKSSALADEVTGLILPLLSRQEKSLFLIEEPEAQLHPEAQVIESILLVTLPSVFNVDIILTTHSDIIAVTLANLFVNKPSRDKIEELVTELIPSPSTKVLTKLVSENIKGKLRVYSFSKDGKVEEVEPKEILREVPSISKVMDLLTSWLLG